jgi:hypothetical protein
LLGTPEPPEFRNGELHLCPPLIRHPQPAVPYPLPSLASEEAAVVSFLDITFIPVWASDEKNSPPFGFAKNV